MEFYQMCRGCGIKFYFYFFYFTLLWCTPSSYTIIWYLFFSSVFHLHQDYFTVVKWKWFCASLGWYNNALFTCRTQKWQYQNYCIGIADKYSHCFIRGLEWAKADNNTTLKTIILVKIKIKVKSWLNYTLKNKDTSFTMPEEPFFIYMLP